jgi:hypothetical protein
LSKTHRACLLCGEVKYTAAVLCKACYTKAGEIYFVLTCHVCKKEFSRERAEAEKGFRKRFKYIYCSMACNNEHNKTKQTPPRPCRRCGAESLKGREFCSRKCVNADLFPPVMRDCEFCKVPFKAGNSRRAFCGRVCASNFHAQRMRGQGNSHFKTGTSYAAWFRNMRPLILERDEHKCALCQKAETWRPATVRGTPTMRSEIVIHHIDEDPRLNHPENLIALCEECHISHHKAPKIPLQWFVDTATKRSSSMTSKWLSTVASLRARYWFTTAS